MYGHLLSHFQLAAPRLQPPQIMIDTAQIHVSNKSGNVIWGEGEKWALRQRQRRIMNADER